MPDGRGSTTRTVHGRSAGSGGAVPELDPARQDAARVALRGQVKLAAARRAASGGRGEEDEGDLHGR